MAYADNNLNHHDDNDDWVLIVPLLRGRGEGGGRGLAACITGGCWNGHQWQSQWWLFEQKRGWTRKKEEGELKDGFVFFMMSYFVIVFGLTFSMQVNWFLPLLLRAAVTIVVQKG
jgi:hypothetical protein